MKQGALKKPDEWCLRWRRLLSSRRGYKNVERRINKRARREAQNEAYRLLNEEIYT